MNIAVHSQKAKQLRADVVKMLYLAKAGHTYGALSCIEMLMSLYYGVARIDPHAPRWPERDRIVLSQGHGRLALHAVLADLGFFTREILWGPSGTASGLEPDGGDLDAALALALDAKRSGAHHRVYVVAGAEETREDAFWYAAQKAVGARLDNLTLMINCDTGYAAMETGRVAARFGAFGFTCFQVDGHDVSAIVEAHNVPVLGGPKVICCETNAGKGVSMMKGGTCWQGRTPRIEDYREAMEELDMTVHA